MRWLKHAFAVDPDGPAEATDAERAVAARLCREIVRRRMATPALMFLEMCRPLNYLGSQAMHFFAPVATTLFNAHGYRTFARFLERRGSIDYLCREIEAMEAGTDRPGDGDRPGDTAPSGDSAQSDSQSNSDDRTADRS